MSEPAALPWKDGPYSTKRHGVTINSCDSEPVQTPGCIQDCGALLVLRRSDLTILQVSENCDRWLGAPAAKLLGQDAAALLGAQGVARLRDLLAGETVECNPIYAFTMPAGPGAPAAQLDLTVHTLGGLALLELEPATTVGYLDGYTLVRRAAARLQSQGTLQGFCTAAAEEVRRATAFDRVMIYRFHRDGHGEVYAECRRDDLPSWLGLHYPAEDIPRPTREIFQKVWVRPLPDARSPLHELLPLANPDTGRPLDMTYCALRGASVMYTEYLHNMGVAATLTMPIRSEGELWGLIACHHYSAPAPVPWPLRAACELLAQMVSLQLKSAAEREHFLYRLRIDGIHQQLVARAAQEGGLAALTEGPPSLLDGLDARGAALYHRERWWRVGKTPDDAQLDALAAWLEGQPELDSPSSPVYVTDSLGQSWPPAAALTAVASGVLAFRLSSARRSLMLWFRPETVQELHWAGNPHDKPSVPGPNGPRLTPRTSFALFRESVKGRSRPWLSVEVEAAARLRLLVMELVVSRAEQLAVLNADLSRSNEELDSFAYVASHDLKEPLRGIYKHAHQLLAEASALDEDNRRRLESLMRLTVRMDSLLDSLLHFSRVGRLQLEPEDVNLNELLSEALEMVGARAAEGSCEIIVRRPLPTVRCDRVRIREVLVNLLSNAFKYNDRPLRRIEIGYLNPDEPGARPAQLAATREHTVYFVRDNGIGIEPRHFNQVWHMFRRLHGRDAYGGGTGAGLSIVKKLVERHSGQVWLDSKLGEGSTFFFTLPQAPAKK
jgi:light-regulated signal transduction histidine kinase (bacteriophytochrome)